MTQIVKADATQMIILQDNLERIGEIIRLEQIAHCVYADVVCVFFVVAPTAQLAVFFLFLLPHGHNGSAGWKRSSCSIQWHKNQIQQAHLAACTGFPGTATGLAGGTERKPQAVR